MSTGDRAAFADALTSAGQSVRYAIAGDAPRAAGAHADAAEAAERAFPEGTSRALALGMILAEVGAEAASVTT